MVARVRSLAGRRLLYVLNLVRPTTFIPVHVEWAAT